MFYYQKAPLYMQITTQKFQLQNWKFFNFCFNHNQPSPSWLPNGHQNDSNFRQPAILTICCHRNGSGKRNTIHWVQNANLADDKWYPETAKMS